MEIQAGSHNGDPSQFTQWRSKPVHTMKIHRWFTQWRSKPVHTMEIHASSHNKDPPPVHTMEVLRPLIRYMDHNQD